MKKQCDDYEKGIVTERDRQTDRDRERAIEGEDEKSGRVKKV